MACNSAWCSWDKRWRHSWTQIIIDFKVNGGVTGTIPEWRKRISLTPLADLKPIGSMNDHELVAAAKSVAQVRPLPQWGDYTERITYKHWVDLLRGTWSQIHFHCISYDQFTYALWANTVEIVVYHTKAVEWARQFVAVWDQAADAYAISEIAGRARLLNPNFDTIEDAAERRFALLEIDDDE